MTASNIRRWLQTVFALAAVGGLVAACATLQAPLSAPSFPQRDLLLASKDGIDIAVNPIEAEDDYLQLFDDYLPKIGIAALWVEVHNNRAAPIELRPANWSVRIGNRSFPAMSVPEVFTRYYKEHHIRMYTVEADRKARLNMEQMSFQQGRIQPSLKHSGFVFFQIDSGAPSGWSRGATLLASGIRLNQRSQTTLEVALSHANS